MKRLFLGVFGGFCVVIVLIGVFNFIHFSKLHSIQQELVRIDRIAQDLQDHKESLQDFGQHKQLFDHIAVSEAVLNSANEQFWNATAVSLSEPGKSQSEKTSVYRISRCKREISSLQKLEAQLITSAGTIGFKDQGLIGRLRSKAHFIEQSYPQFNMRLLSLRRHEKDFLMRLDPVYLQKMHDEIELWKSETTLPDEVLIYSSNFDSLATACLDLFGKTGLYARWNSSFDVLQREIRMQRSVLLRESFAASSGARFVNLLINSLAILIALGCTIHFTRRFSSQVVQLQKSMEQYIAANYSYSSDLLLKIPRNEFGKITVHFLQLTRKIKADMQLLEDRVARRTRSLEIKNAQLELQHLEIMDSLRYARDLQQSLLVSRTKVLRSFREALIHYLPKDIVGGDFYWLREVTGANVHRTYFALADCTGHGVPGALLSVMGMNALDELVESGTEQPADLLNELRSLVTRRLNTHEDKRNDGMDLALFMWDHKTNELMFAGAQMPLWIIRKGGIIELKGQRMPIGYTFFEVNPFRQQTVQLLAGDKLVLFSDGIVDQFGGSADKKLGKKALRELLTKYADEPGKTLYSKLVLQHEQWKGQTEQTDDCTLVLLEPSIINGAVMKVHRRSVKLNEKQHATPVIPIGTASEKNGSLVKS